MSGLASFGLSLGLFSVLFGGSDGGPALTHVLSGSSPGLVALLYARGWRQQPGLCVGQTACEAHGMHPDVRLYTRRLGEGGVDQIAYIWPQEAAGHYLPGWGVCVADADTTEVDLSSTRCADPVEDFTEDVLSSLALLRHRAPGGPPWLELRHGLGELDAYMEKQSSVAACAAEAAFGDEAAFDLSCEASMPAVVPLEEKLLDTLIWRDNADDKLIALTFDACSTFYHGNYNPKVIDLLVEHKVPATLFIGGHWAEMHPSALQELASHPQFELGNHTYSHPHMTQLSPSRQREELLWTQYLIYKLTGQMPRFYRPPYGEISDQTIFEAARLGLFTVEYDLPAGDADVHVSVRRLVDWVVGRASSGSIVIMHMNHPESKTAEMLPEVIASLRAKGYRFAKVSELLQHIQKMGAPPDAPPPLTEKRLHPQ
jgi:peptidoglycan/xylan/chitin deacetylase (PgdA/CDA1 family)